MVEISKEEIMKIARISQLELEEHEIQSLITQIKDVLEYAQRVKEVVSAESKEKASMKNINVFREDVLMRTQAEPLRALAPRAEESYFVVPSILESK